MFIFRDSFFFFKLITFIVWYYIFSCVCVVLRCGFCATFFCDWFSFFCFVFLCWSTGRCLRSPLANNFVFVYIYLSCFLRFFLSNFTSTKSQWNFPTKYILFVCVQVPIIHILYICQIYIMFTMSRIAVAKCQQKRRSNVHDLCTGTAQRGLKECLKNKCLTYKYNVKWCAGANESDANEANKSKLIY